MIAYPCEDWCMRPEEKEVKYVDLCVVIYAPTKEEALKRYNDVKYYIVDACEDKVEYFAELLGCITDSFEYEGEWCIEAIISCEWDIDICNYDVMDVITDNQNIRDLVTEIYIS